MRVLFDAFELSRDGGKSIGIYNYAVNVWRALQQALPPHVELVLACHGANAQDFPVMAAPGGTPGRAHVRVLSPGVPGRWRRQHWLRFGAQRLARSEACTLYFSPKGFLPGWWGRTWGLRTCAVVHDLIPLWYAEQHPSQFGWLEAMVVNQGLVRTCLHADRLVTISQAAADDMRRRLPAMRPPTVVHNGLPPAPAQVRHPDINTPYLFAITSNLPHKNAGMLLEGYRQYRQASAAPLDLVVCGIQDPAQEGVRAVRGLSNEELHGYLRGAELFVFLSLMEGFGFPPLEAMMHGTPSLCSDIAVLRETTMGNAFFVDPARPDGIARALADALSHEAAARREAIRARAPHVTAQFTWERCARALADTMLAGT